MQNLGRRKIRTSLLIAAVAISSAIAFAGAVTMRSISASMEVGLTRLGADLMVVPKTTLTNITAALLTVEPSDQTMPADAIAATRIAGIARVSAQRVFRTDQSGFGAHSMPGMPGMHADHGELVDLIGFDPESDFTVQPWITERLDRAMAPGDVIVGAARDLTLGSELVLFGKPFRVYAKLGRTGSGTHERGVFMPSSSLIALAPAVKEAVGTIPPMLEPGNATGFLIENAPGKTELQVRFALLSQLPDVKVIAGGSLLTGIRQGLVALLGGMLGLVALLATSTAVMVAVLFSAVVAERRRELGLLKAIGARRSQIIALTITEAVIATAGGGVIGVAAGLLLLRLVERALVYHVSQMGVSFIWMDRLGTVSVAVMCVVVAAFIGMIGAAIPAWRVGRQQPHDLIWGDN